MNTALKQGRSVSLDTKTFIRAFTVYKKLAQNVRNINILVSLKSKYLKASDSIYNILMKLFLFY